MRTRVIGIALAGVLAAVLLCVPSLLRTPQAATQVIDAATLATDEDQAPYDIVERYRLPAFDHEPGDSTEKLLASQVVAKAQSVGITSNYPSDPGPAMRALQEDIESHRAHALNWHSQVDFTGTTAAELQELIDAHPDALIKLTMSDLVLDAPIVLPSDTHIEGNGARIWCELAGAAFVVEGTRDISLQNLDIRGNGDIGIFAHNAINLLVEGCHIHDLRSKAIVVSGESTYFHLLDNVVRQNQQGGIEIAGGSSYGVLSGNDVVHNTGYSNWMAGIVLTNVDVPTPAELWAAFPGEMPHFAERTTLADVPASVHDVIVEGNTVERNQSSGIYLDGIYRCYVQGNTIAHNDKEGMCLDYGTLGCFVQGNTVSDNGKRARQSDAALELDGMLPFGRMADGSACAKLPGISLDNAAYNIIEANTIQDNWGGGVKSVRTSMRNVIAGNLIDNNNRGQNDVFFFIGVELGNADEGAQSDSMDYLADYQNLVMGNTITGGHYTGVFIAHGCEGNTISRNVIKGHTHYALMCGSNLVNDFSGNDYDGRFIDRSVIPFL